MKKLPKFIKNGVKTLSFMKVSRFCFYAFIFMLPFQIDAIVYTSPIFESGNFNYLTSVFVYLTDFLFLVTFICWGIAIFRNEFKEKITYGNPLIAVLFIIFLVLAEISVFVAHDQWLAFSIVLRFFELMLMYLYVVNKTVKLNVIINVFIATVTLQALMAVLQYITQGSLGFYFLGESHIASDIYGVAKIQLEDGGALVRAYGTLPHPNILAGFLLTGILFTYHRMRQKEYIAYPILFLLIAAFVLAFSRGAFLALLVAALVFISLKESRISFKYILFAIAILGFFVVLFNLEQTIFTRLLVMNDSSLTERVFYFGISKQMFYAFPFGIGLGGFTFMMGDFTSVKLMPWDFQPVHNVYMLIANEMGIIALAIFLILIGTFAVLLFLRMKKATAHIKNLGGILIAILVGIFVIGLFDHYLITLYHGQVLLFFLFAIYGRYIISKNH